MHSSVLNNFGSDKGMEVTAHQANYMRAYTVTKQSSDGKLRLRNATACRFILRNTALTGKLDLLEIKSDRRAYFASASRLRYKRGNTQASNDMAADRGCARCSMSRRVVMPVEVDATTVVNSSCRVMTEVASTPDTSKWMLTVVTSYGVTRV